MSSLSTLVLTRFLAACSDDAQGGTQPSLPDARSPQPPPSDGDEIVEAGGPIAPVVEEPSAGNPEWEQLAQSLCVRNAGGVAYTAQSPGPWSGKERAHVPQMTIQSDGVAVIVVNHVMDPGGSSGDAGADAGRDAGKDASVAPTHFVTTIWAKDDEGRVVYLKQFKATDAAPPFVAFRIPAGTRSLRAFEHCNLHGAWASDPT